MTTKSKLSKPLPVIDFTHVEYEGVRILDPERNYVRAEFTIEGSTLTKSGKYRKARVRLQLYRCQLESLLEMTCNNRNGSLVESL